MNDGETFLILEPQRVVQVDLAQSLLEICPDALILRADSAGEAERVLGDITRLSGAIVGIGATELKESGVNRHIAGLGGWIICLNGRRTDYILAEGWHPLARPFSSEDAQRLVLSLLDSRRATAAAG